jgi:hypothetical protein
VPSTPQTQIPCGNDKMGESCRHLFVIPEGNLRLFFALASTFVTAGAQLPEGAFLHRPSQIILPPGWFKSEESPGVDCSLQGIYVWTIDGVGTYVGRYTSITRPRRHYASIVMRLLNGQPYRKSKPDRFRRIHHALASAVKNGNRITLIILENPPADELNARERELIRQIGTLND